MSLDGALGRVVDRLHEAGVPFRLIGAAALAAHGVARSTQDVDLLVADPRVLDRALWLGALPAGFTIDVRLGDSSDPLLGVVRVEEEAPDLADWDHPPEQLDLVLLRARFAARMVTSDGPTVHFGPVALRAVGAADLVLLKLYAGGPKDRWDVLALLDAHPDRSALVAEVDATVGALPPEARAAWQAVRSGGP